MLSYEEMEFNPKAENLVKILCNKTQNDDPLFFRVNVAYYLCQIASMQRVSIKTHDRGSIPINIYALNLSPSGTGKGLSTNIMENKVTHLFRERFISETFPILAAENLPKIANKRANRKAASTGGLIDPEEELQRVQKEFDALGPLVFSFDSGTAPAVKQLRHKLLMANAGAMCLQIDEIGSNFIGSMEILNPFLELYDVGLIKQKLIKNTADSARSEEIIGRTPTNMMLFGTPSRLLNGGKTEEELYAMLETGYARRCFFGYAQSSKKKINQTAQEVYDQLTQGLDDSYLDDLALELEHLADLSYTNRELTMSKDVALLSIEYRLNCERIAEALPEHEEIRKAELTHRYFKATKLAGAYAFIDDSLEITEAHMYQAIKLAELSGEAFGRLLTRDRPYVKLAKYIAANKKEITQADLVEDLPFYRGTLAHKNEMMSLAIAYGYKNNIIIKKSFSDGVEFLRGESIEETNLNQMILSYSSDIADGYKNQLAPFEKLHTLTNLPNMHWINHHLQNGKDGNGHRCEDEAIAGFNMIVLDVDGGVKMEAVKQALQGYKYLLHTTKRHTDEDHRFRVILPTNYLLKLDAKEFKDFMKNLYEWLPFDLDSGTNQRARKWLTNNGHYEYADGELLDVLPFIPKTTKNEERKAKLSTQADLDNLERWVLNNIGDGNRNKMLHRFAMILIDNGAGYDEVYTKVKSLNEKIADKLDETELMTTIMATVAKTLATKS